MFSEAAKESRFRKASSYDDLKEQYGWKEGDSIIISKYRPLKGFDFQLTTSMDGTLNVAHEQIIWIQPDGNVDLNLGYGPHGLQYVPTDFSQSLFGEMSHVPAGVNPFNTWRSSGLFLPTQDGGMVFGNATDGYGFVNYNCQGAANWLHGQFR